MTSTVQDNKMNATIPDSPISDSPIGFSAVPEGYKTPPRAISAGSPPSAPLRVRRADSLVEDDSASFSNASPSDEACRCFGNRINLVLIPSVDDHKGKGILAGDFIKPDPSATMAERQTHILSELHNWLSGCIQVHARDLDIVDGDQVETADMVDDGMWPAARLHMIVKARRSEDEEGRVAAEIVYNDAATWATNICMQFLINGVETSDSMIDTAIGFVTTDKLPDGSTIVDHWDSPSVFEPLRVAEPLSLDDRIDRALEFWDIPLKLEFPIWVWTAISFWIVLYAWIVAYLVSGPTR